MGTHPVGILLHPIQPRAALPQVLDLAGRLIQATWVGPLRVDPHRLRQVMPMVDLDGPSHLRAIVPDRRIQPHNLDHRLQLQALRPRLSPMLDSRPIKILIR